MVLVYINPSLAIFLSVLCLIVSGGIIYLLFRLAKKERKKYLDEVMNYIDGVDTKNELIAGVNAYISRRDAHEFNLLMIDFDNFKDVTTNFGQIEAQKITQKIIQKIIKVMPLRMSIGRLKEEQFVIFERGDYSREEMVRLAKRILEVVREPVTLYGEASINVTCSIGIAYFPTHGKTFKQLLSSLEIAVFGCKRNGGDQYHIYSPESSENEGANMEYYYQIKEGIKNKEFSLYYQPIIDGKNEDIYAIEGLLRWNHPTLGLLSPFKFISIMEQTGDIHWVGLWGFETIVNKYLELKSKFNRDFKMSINLSPKQLANEGLPQSFQKILKKYKVSANNFILEIEEFTIYEGLEIVQENLEKLSRLGFSIAVDGMGLDYKALKKLEENAISIIKMDRDFLNEEDELIKSKFIDILNSYAQDNNCVLIGEGVEDFDYLKRARTLNINLYQGYLFSKAISPEEIDEYITEKRYLSKLHIKNNEELDELEEELEESNNDENVDLDVVENNQEKNESIDDSSLDDALNENDETDDSIENKKKEAKNSQETSEELEEESVLEESVGAEIEMSEEEFNSDDLIKNEID